ncbi:CidA/LrgA family protein [Paenibacillus turpanensis]|uniref:CidA/LrgA family protein n=1 Tax=Paenibacillus turpanensis TaxID=2689078 RepID=UPI00140BDBF3|nr:CidA/LrgA family protein [Paenibacillus turpanensis]
MKGFAVLALFYGAGLAGHHVLGIPMPAGVLGMLLLAAALFTGTVSLQTVEESAQFLLRHMMLFFIPFIVVSPIYFAGLGGQWLPAAAGFLGSFIASLAAAGWVTRLLGRGGGKRHGA